MRRSRMPSSTIADAALSRSKHDRILNEDEWCKASARARADEESAQRQPAVTVLTTLPRGIARLTSQRR